jgi:hypothetical protein
MSSSSSTRTVVGIWWREIAGERSCGEGSLWLRKTNATTRIIATTQKAIRKARNKWFILRIVSIVKTSLTGSLTRIVAVLAAAAASIA